MKSSKEKQSNPVLNGTKMAIATTAPPGLLDEGKK